MFWEWFLVPPPSWTHFVYNPSLLIDIRVLSVCLRYILPVISVNSLVFSVSAHGPM